MEELRRLTKEERRQVYDEVFREAFPPSELKPLRAIERMIENGEDIPLHTVKGWAARGPFRVKKGEHGLETRLWKKGQDVPAIGEWNREFLFARDFGSVPV